MLSPEHGGDNQKRAEPGKWPDPLIAFPAHTAALQMAFYQGSQFPAKYRGGLFIAFHGSWNRAPKPQKGYRVMYVPFDENGMPRGDYEVFADGFTGLDREFTQVSEARFRPAGLAFGPDGSLYVGDSEKGRIWRIIYTGETSTQTKPIAKTDAAPAPVIAAANVPKVYAQICSACHMADGSGVSNLQPPLAGSAVANGDADQVINVVLRGPAQVLPASRPHYGNVMPAFVLLSDADIAEVLTYVRSSFGNHASAITPAQVAAQRALLP
jgi:mono/diheme cytochrome c family protein